ncbi:fumarylacetoacetate hydrolase family protein [Brevundimonas diminuta]|uniref:fumarylacetoacetate hydrolase family protein n=1 Tax=Brevundimonas diminuta TaxID=293 RepID=UPI002097CC37|nr:fumarylacetoacetate hydrolase family protein [Brevundimonas diminuta]MCO8019187.1 fumarylacetoacetate hydrolase family protein [Brevundimonas diminuta]MCO8021864.1 fumarylacetoacetate hydrolase family protein [Brevundimonas diminuta]
MTLAFQPTAPILAATDAKVQFPVRRVFCVGRNYAAHAREMGRDPDREPPFFFTAWAETVVPGGIIAYPQSTANYHYEAELVVAIGKSGRNLAVADAMDHVWGYATGLDMTRRDLQLEAREQGRPWDTGKNVEQSSPLGVIHKAGSDGFNPDKGAIRLTVNGDVRQEADLADLIWPVADVIAYLSTLYRLEPGDLIYTGTPAGVGAVVEGDEITVSIDGLTPLSVKIGPLAT